MVFSVSRVKSAVDGGWPAGTHGAMGNKILFIEDDQDWRLMVSTALKDAGYEVLAVPGAAEALLQKNEAGFSLIILDLDLGGENGLMLLQHLKRNHPAAPIILHTGIERDHPAIQQILNRGAHQYVRKGAISELVAAVAGALTIGQSTQPRMDTNEH
jgi:DNA-binding NtrC family response regulator